MNWKFNGLVCLLASVMPMAAWAGPVEDDEGDDAPQATAAVAVRVAPVPVIAHIADQRVALGTTYRFLPRLQQGGLVNWSKTFGPDDVKVDPVTGQVTWAVPRNMASESFYIGIKATNGSGTARHSWIVHAGVSQVIRIGPTETYKTLGAAFNSPHEPGATFVVRDGTYTGYENAIARLPNGGLQYPKAGTPTRTTTVIAETPGRVILADKANISISGYAGTWGHAAFKGFFVKDGTVSVYGEAQPSAGGNCNLPSCRPHHIKFTHNGVQSADHVPLLVSRADDILLENNYVFGGGRYKIATYHANRVVMRRNVARFDQSAVVDDNEPKGTYAAYTSLDVALSNNLAVDADQPKFINKGEHAGEFGCPTTSGPSRVTFDRNMQINSDLMYGNLDNIGGVCDAQIRDVVSWDVRPSDGALIRSRGAALFNHVTLGRIHPNFVDAIRSHVGFVYLINAWPSDQARGFTNSVIHDVADGDLFYGFLKRSGVAVNGRVTDRLGIERVNISNTPGLVNAGDTDVVSVSKLNPIHSGINPTGGLRYLTRVEPGSNLSGKASDGGDLGATVMTFKGKSGTFWGEPGHDRETDVPMWPFPLENVIHTKMREYSYTGPMHDFFGRERRPVGTGSLTGMRGFAMLGNTLSNYVWGYLGDVVPPFNVNAGLLDGKAIVLWDPPAPKERRTVTGYNVYAVDAGRRTRINAAPLSTETFHQAVPGLVSGRTYTFAVTALRGNRESGAAYLATLRMP